MMAGKDSLIEYSAGNSANVEFQVNSEYPNCDFKMRCVRTV
jgi:hypothetical protein